MALELPKFTPNEIVVSRADAARIYRFFWPWSKLGPGDMTDKDLAYTQGLLVEAIDASYKIGFVEILFRASARPAMTPDDVVRMIRTIVKRSARHWFRNRGDKSLDDARIYEMVRSFVAYRFKPEFALRCTEA